MNEASKMPRIYTSPTQSAETVEIIADMDLLEEKLINMPNVKTESEAEVVGEYRAQFRTKAKLLDKKRLEMTSGARQTVSMLNDAFRPLIERTERCVQLADNKLLPFMQERERIRREEERKRREHEEAERKAAQAEQDAIDEAKRVAAETQDAEALKEAEDKVKEGREALDALRRTPIAKPAPKAVTGSLGSSVSMHKVWKYKITDFSKIPDEYLIPEVDRLHKGKLNQMAKGEQENAFVPGIEFYFEEAMGSRPGVVK